MLHVDVVIHLYTLLRSDSIFYAQYFEDTIISQIRMPKSAKSKCTSRSMLSRENNMFSRRYFETTKNHIQATSLLHCERYRIKKHIFYA